MGGEQSLLKIKQKLRRKKKLVYLSKNQLDGDNGDCFEDIMWKRKGDKKKYQVCSTHRRSVSLLEVGEEDGGGEEGYVRCMKRGGKISFSADVVHFISSSIELFENNEAKVVPETQVQYQGGRGSYAKVLAAKKVLVLQKKSWGFFCGG